MFNELSYELADVRTALRFLEKRVDTVERLALADSACRAADAVPIRPSPTTDDFIPSLMSVEQTCLRAPIKLAQNRGSVATTPEQMNDAENFLEESNSAREGLEVFVGRNLNKLGISFLVIGCALALVYQFQYFAPVLKIISGLIGGALLIWGGEKFEKNNAKMAWYGRALIGGGWALSYFSIFAAHHFDSVRIIESAAADFALLFAVASASVFHSLKYKSETITGITLTLALATICLSPATSFSVLACTILVAALVGLCSKMNWFNLFVYGECVFYAVYLRFILPQIMQGQNAFFGMNSADGNFFTGIACSVFCWMAMNVVIFTSKELAVGERNRLVLASLINCGAFVPAVLVLMANSHEEMRFGFLLATGIAYLISTMTASQSATSGPLSCNRILALSLVTMAVPLKLTGDWMSVFLSLEVPVLVWAGLQYEMPSVRIFAGILACLAAGSTAGAVLFPAVTSLNSLLAAAIAFTAYGVSAALYEDHRSKGNLTDRLAFHFYYALCAGIAMATFGSSLIRTWITTGFIVGSMLTVFIGLKLSDKRLRVAGEIALFLGLPVFVMIMHATGRSLTICSTILGLVYLANERGKVEGSDRFTQVVYQGAVASMFAVLAAQWFSFFTLQSMFALEALAILVYGFIKREKSVMIVAFLASAFLALKFLILDITSIASMDLFGQTVSMPLLYGLVCATTLLTTSMMYLSKRLSSYSGDSAVGGFYSHFVLTALVVAALTQSQVPTHWLSLALTVQGVFVLTLGFKYRMKGLRVSGLLLLGLVIARLLFIELASVSTIYRIMSFIGAGVVLLVASLAYAKMSNETAITKS
ncbi:hypothetical protein BH10CYA1_BH10CYA1_36560 [soil metagenome]